MAGHEIEKGEVNIMTTNDKPIERNTSTKVEEKDCTDQLLECTSECDPNDKECETVCVEDYKECEYPWEDEIPMENVPSIEHDEGELISEILQIAALLGGSVERTETVNSTGRASKKIIIEYNVTNKPKT